MKLKEVSAIFSQFPDKLLSQLVEETGVDHGVSRLGGALIFKLLIFSMLRSNRLSTRVLEHFYNSELFSAFSGKGGHKTRHSSLASRLSHMNADYFAQLFDWSSEHFAKDLSGKNNKLSKQVNRFDSTMCAISSALVNWGMRVRCPPKEGPAKVQVKFTVGLRDLLPSSLDSFFQQQHLSEERTLKEAIQKAAPSPEELVVFDLGLKSRKTLQLFDQEGLNFITKGGDNLRYEHVSHNRQINGRSADGLKFIQDSKVYLYVDGHRLMEHPFRLVEAEVEEYGKRLYFLSNVWELSAMDIARAYRYRWDIEVFFRFIKQELNVKHLINRSENGIQIQLYAALINAILLTVFKVNNKIESFKVAKLKFEEELLLLIMRLRPQLKPT